LTVAHLDHALREESAQDAKFVAKLAERLGLAFVTDRRDVGAEAKRRGEGIEQAARRVRYEFLAAAARRAGCDRVAVGHNADDNVETILHRIIRGTHIRGLAGIPAVRPLGDSEVLLVRPLLSCRRQQIESYCRAAGLSWRTDPTNAQTHYRRNFIRHELLPLLRRSLNARADEALLRLGEAAGQTWRLIESLASKILDQAERPGRAGGIVLDAEVLQAEPELLRRVVLQLALERAGVPMRSIGAGQLQRLDAIVMQRGAAAVSLPGCLEARRVADEVHIGPGEADTRHEASGQVELDCPGRTSLGRGVQVECEIGDCDPQGFAAHCRSPDGWEWIVADKLIGRLLARPRRPGDAFRPLGAPGRQSVSDFLTNAKVPPEVRRRIWCICDQRGIVYVAPLRIDERVKVTPTTCRVMRIRLVCDAALADGADT